MRTLNVQPTEAIVLPRLNGSLKAALHTPIYLMHKFHARKPHNVVKESIRAHTVENEIVLDPFCGSGVAVVEGLRLGPNVIGMDLDPMATFITEMTVLPVNLDKFKEAFNKIEKNINDIEHEVVTADGANRSVAFADLYSTQCSNCGGIAKAIHTEWDNN